MDEIRADNDGFSDDLSDTNSDKIIIDEVTNGKLPNGVFTIIFIFKNLFMRE